MYIEVIFSEKKFKSIYPSLSMILQGLAKFVFQFIEISNLYLNLIYVHQIHQFTQMLCYWYWSVVVHVVLSCTHVIQEATCTRTNLMETLKILVLTFQFNFFFWTHLGWPSGIDLGSGNVLLLKVSGSILSGANFRGLV